MKKIFSFDYHKYDSLSELSDEESRLVMRAREACESAYAPYSNFKVGVAALLESGEIITGSNQESEVFPAGVCAERALLFHHQSNHVGDAITMLAITSKPDAKECYPCGICRQTIIDSERRQGSPIRVIMAGADSATVTPNAKCLMPFIFEL